jgi:hypothetical protein
MVGAFDHRSSWNSKLVTGRADDSRSSICVGFVDDHLFSSSRSAAFFDCVDYRRVTSGSQRLNAICSRCEQSKNVLQ